MSSSTGSSVAAAAARFKRQQHQHQQQPSAAAAGSKLAPLSVGASEAAATIHSAREHQRLTRNILERDERRPSLPGSTSFSSRLTWFKRFASELQVAASLHPADACSAPNSPRTKFEARLYESGLLNGAEDNIHRAAAKAASTRL